MKGLFTKIVAICMIFVLFSAIFMQVNGSDVTKANTNEIVLPKLEVQGRKLINSHTGEHVQLRGMSTHGIAWYPKFVNKDAFAWLKENMNISIVRVSMYTSEWGGYCVNTGNKANLKALVKSAVESATELGLYVIIDWHMLGADSADMQDCNPMTYVNEAKEFFGEMSEYYKDYPNVIYEICNEPNDGEYGNSYDVNWNVIKEYANQVIPVIRKNTDNIIIVGTPDWSSDVMSAANDLSSKDSLSKKYENIMYTYHFYAAAHGSWYRNNVKSALDAGLPIFVTEFDSCNAAGSGSIDKNSTKQWLDLLDSYGVSYVKWNISNKDETSALIVSSCNKTSGWNMNEISESGQYMINEYLTRISENKYGISAPKPVEPETEEPTTEEITMVETTTERVTSIPKEASVEINGYQISYATKGFRVIYSGIDDNEDIEEIGLVYGLSDYASESELVVGSNNDTVKSYQATDIGKVENSYSENSGTQSYVMTMRFIDTASFYSSNISVKAYAKLKTGKYIYSNVAKFTVYDIADYLYQRCMMNKYVYHNYLYQDILTKVKPKYSQVDYDWGAELVQ